MMEHGAKFGAHDVDRVLDTPFLVNSEFYNGIQIVDLVTYLIK